MADRENFWRLEHLSDRQLLERLHGVLRTQRGALAELVAQLAEVEERRLHLAMAHGSMFSYCVGQLGMSEDEACRRIELARLARKFPLLFAELASGSISLSVALLLKPVLTPVNHAELIASVRGASLRTARELLAARFPSPDVPSRIRKLPERLLTNAAPAAIVGIAHSMPADADSMSAVASTTASAMPAVPTGVTNATPLVLDGVVTACVSSSAATMMTAPALTLSSRPPQSAELEFGSPAGVAAQHFQVPATAAEPSHAPMQASSPRYSDRLQRTGQHQAIDPLSAERYRIVFTADVHLKQKLELARDLLRHSNPSGDLAPVVSRALDLLLAELGQRRFGARRKDTSHRTARPASDVPPAATAPATAQPSAVAAPVATPRSSAPPIREPGPPTPATPSVGTAFAASHIVRAARREVLERDGLGCVWVDATGKRCGSTAWLEFDHHHPRGKGGCSESDNLRLLCRAHNRFAAERAYGREHIERAIQARQRNTKRPCPNGPPPASSPAAV